ncbi:hypothetical protein TNCV_3574691 [Trichonephila clavipes]|nr:hypothetical protein TNCV_3574691 [Trichonephila clavipes]
MESGGLSSGHSRPDIPSRKQHRQRCFLCMAHNLSHPLAQPRLIGTFDEACTGVLFLAINLIRCSWAGENTAQLAKDPKFNRHTEIIPLFKSFSERTLPNVLTHVSASGSHWTSTSISWPHLLPDNDCDPFFEMARGPTLSKT